MTNDLPSRGNIRPEAGQQMPDEKAKASPTPPTTLPAAGETAPVARLTPEEQMALYEKELKETDWGHQPC